MAKTLQKKIKFSKGQVSPELIELAQASGLPFLPYSDDEDRVETVAKFYKSL